MRLNSRNCAYVRKCAYVCMCFCTYVRNIAHAHIRTYARTHTNTYAHTHIRTNESGIALLLVISAIVVLTMLAVELAYNSQVEYHLAVRQKERLQAYYLAQSAYQLTLMELKMGNAVGSQVAQATQQAGIQLPTDMSAPLCEQFPIKTSLMRLLMSGESPEAGKEEPEGEGLPRRSSEGAEAGEPDMAAMAGIPLSGLEEFLQFEGDFDAECKDESAKIDLNFFYAQDPARPSAEGQDNAYDAYKKFIIQFLSQPKFQELFQEKDVRIPEVVRNIADWIDPNDAINEMGGGQGGAEESVYQGDDYGPMTAKNGKLSTPMEVYRIAGVEDDWWDAVKDHFTIYGMADERGNPQVNVCRASDEIVQGLILRYLETRKDLPPIPPGNAELMPQLVDAVKGGCTGVRPDKNKIAQDLDAKLTELLKPGTAIEMPSEGGGTAGGTQTGGYTQTTSAFGDWISTASRFYNLNLIGQVKETVVKINAVIDMGEQGGTDTNKWKVVYWRVE